jgi:electron transport complex protein RnfG
MKWLRIRSLMVLALLGGVLVPSAPAVAQGTYWSRADLLRSFFPDCERVTYTRLELSPEQRKAVARRLGAAAPERFTVFYGLSKGKLAGYAILDEERGQHEPISFGVLTDAHGQVARVEVMVYRESYGEEVREERFREQFTGKDAKDPVRVGTDIVAISGATISSRALAVGTKRAVVLLNELVITPGLTLATSR